MPQSTDWQLLRAEIPAAKEWAFFDHAAVSPMSRPACRAMEQYARQSSESGSAAWAGWTEQVEQVRRFAARQIDAPADEVAFVPNTTAGITCVAENFPWQTGDNLVTLANEFPSNLYPWLNLQRRGVQVRMVAPPDLPSWHVADLLTACDDRTRLISVSWVGYASGWRADLEALAAATQRRGIALMVDAIQGLGVFPLSLRQTPIDFLAADGHKWLLGPEGAGLLYVRRCWLPRLGATPLGWNSVRRRFDYSHVDPTPRDCAARFEAGTNNQAGILALGASIRLLSKLGWGPHESPLGRHVLDLADSLAEQLASVGGQVQRPGPRERMSGIVSFVTSEDPRSVRQRCLEQKVAVSCRDGRLRASVHAYNDQTDAARLLAAVAPP